MYARQLIKVYPVQFFPENERRGFNWGFPLFYDYAFESVTPEVALAVVTPVVKTRKSNLNFTHKLRKVG